jgi:hypothetical protein
MSDGEHDERLRVAARAAGRSAVQSSQQAVEAQGVLPHGLGAEVRKTRDRAKQDPTTGVSVLVQKMQKTGSRNPGAGSGPVVRDQESSYMPGLIMVGLSAPSVAVLAQNSKEASLKSASRRWRR